SGSVGRGLAKLGSGVGSLIAFATQPGNVAFDGSGRNSPFTTALLRHLGTPGQDITRDLVHVRRDVLEATYGKQVPWDNSSLTGDVVLNPLP
ncbi:MAG: caspase family protein, partial [Mesorhizobium sp.]